MSAPIAPGLAERLGTGAWPGTVRIVDGCTACGLCIQTCPDGALRRAPRQPLVIDDRCTGCLACIEVCPRDCIVEERIHP